MLALLLVVLVPAPDPPYFSPGCWDLRWGQYRQICWFDGDCRYSSSPGRGKYSVTDIGAGRVEIFFTEGGNDYLIRIDKEGNGSGWRLTWDENGERDYGETVNVKLTRRLPMPKGEP